MLFSHNASLTFYKAIMEVDQNIFKKISIHLIIRMKIRNCSFISRKSTKHKVKIGKQSSFLWGSYETFSHEYMIPFFCHYSYRMIAFCFCTSSNLHQVSLCGLSYQTTKSAKEKTVCLSFVSWLVMSLLNRLNETMTGNI